MKSCPARQAATRALPRACIALATIAMVTAPSDSAETLTIGSALVRAIDNVEVPAREAGVIAEILVREGTVVATGDLLARIDATASKLEQQRAELELKLARMEAENDVSVRFAEKSLATAQAELRRAEQSDKQYPRSVSQTELEQLRLTVARSALEIEQAKHQRAVAIASTDLKENQLAAAAWGVQRCAIRSPLAGVVVQVHHRAGEWVSPGDAVVRVVRVDRLRAESFLSAEKADATLVGRPVVLETTVSGGKTGRFAGKIVFVGTEVDPVNGQVRLWAEIDNRGRRLRPGLRGTMVIEPATTADRTGNERDQ